jgi:hypothetical protein
MFKTKPISFNAIITYKLFKTDNVPVNVVVVITIIVKIIGVQGKGVG